MQTEPHERACVACGANDVTPKFQNLVVCSSCGMVYYPQQIQPETVRDTYRRAYFHGEEYSDYTGDQGARAAQFKVLISRIEDYVPHGGKVYEIGCAYGFWLNIAKTKWQVRGCDICEDACAHARDVLRLDVECGSFSRIGVASGELDAVCMWDTVEHVDALDEMMHAVADAVKPGGILALTTSDIGSLLARVRGPRWRQVHPPSHIWHFSSSTVRRMLSRFGFDVVALSHEGVTRTVGQIIYSLTTLRTGRPSRLYGLCERWGLDKLRIWLNAFDEMLVIARRRCGPTDVSPLG